MSLPPSIVGATADRDDVHVCMQGAPGCGWKGGGPYRRTLPQLSRFGMNVAQEGI
jgi:hypothetical protein